VKVRAKQEMDDEIALKAAETAAGNLFLAVLLYLYFFLFVC
jgi:hypothetical protein